MGETEEDKHGLRITIGAFELVQPNSFSICISVVCKFKCKAWDTKLFVTKLRLSFARNFLSNVKGA